MKSQRAVPEFGGLVWKDGVQRSLPYMRLVNHRLHKYFLRSILCMLMAAAAAASSSSPNSHWKYDVFLNFRGLEAAASSSSSISTKLWIRKQSTPSSTPKSFKRQRPFGPSGSY